MSENLAKYAEQRQKPTTITMMNLCRLDGSVLGTTENGIKITIILNYWRGKNEKTKRRS